MQWLMLQQDEPEGFVLLPASDTVCAIRECRRQRTGHADSLGWCGVDENGYDYSGKCIVSVDPRYFRHTEVETLLGDAIKAKVKLGWSPKVTFDELVAEMVCEDLKAAD